MRKLFVCLCVLCLLVGVVFAETTIEKVDRMHEEELHRENQVFMKDVIPSASNTVEKAELYWRLARTTLEVGDLLELEGVDKEVLLETFIEGEGYGDKSIELNPNSYWGYYWKSANMGRWGEVKGILNSLFKAKPMRDLLQEALAIYPDHPDSFYVLGIMYRKVPGFPISFGSTDKAVSLGRKSIDAQRAEYQAGKANEIKLSYFMELARSLKQRNWSASKRRKKLSSKADAFRKESDVLDKNLNYEGTIDIPDVSDEEEAIDIMRWVISEFRAKPVLKDSHKTDLAEALVDLEVWTK